MQSSKTLIIRKGTKVGVAKGTEFPVTFTEHTMKRDMAVPYPTPDDCGGPMVLERAENLDRLDIAATNIYKALTASSLMFSKSNLPWSVSFYGILNFGWDIIVTGNDEYPFMIVHKKDVDETDDWDVEDKGDGVKVFTHKPGFDSVFTDMMENYIKHCKHTTNTHPWKAEWEEQHR